MAKFKKIAEIDETKGHFQKPECLTEGDSVISSKEKDKFKLEIAWAQHGRLGEGRKAKPRF